MTEQLDQMPRSSRSLLWFWAVSAEVEQQESLGERWEGLQSVTKKWMEQCFPRGADGAFKNTGIFSRMNSLTKWLQVKRERQREPCGFTVNVRQPSGTASDKVLEITPLLRLPILCVIWNIVGVQPFAARPSTSPCCGATASDMSLCKTAKVTSRLAST